MLKKIIPCILLVLLCGCTMKEYPPCANQPLENVVSIEFLENQEFVCTLPESELEAFWADFMAIKFHRFINDPPTEYGELAVKITYADGYYDIIGQNVNWYFAPTGKGVKTKVYYAVNKEDFVTLFADYLEVK